MSMDMNRIHREMNRSMRGLVLAFVIGCCMCGGLIALIVSLSQ